MNALGGERSSEPERQLNERSQSKLLKNDRQLPPSPHLLPNRTHMLLCSPLQVASVGDVEPDLTWELLRTARVSEEDATRRRTRAGSEGRAYLAVG